MRQRSSRSSPRTHAAGRGASPWRLEWLVAGTATVVAVVLACSALAHHHALWRDEMNSVATAGAASIGDLWRLLEFESFPALWLLGLRGWMAAGGGSDTALRLWGAGGVILLVGAMWFAARRANHGVPLLGLSLLAVNSDILRWGSTVRAWSVGAALGIVAWTSIRDLVTSPSRRAVIVATAAGVAAVQTTYQNAVFVCAFAAAAAVEIARGRSWRDATAPIGVALVSVASLLPYVPTLARRADWIGVSQRPVSLGHLLTEFGNTFRASGDLAPWVWTGAAVLVVAAIVTRRGAPAYAGLSALLAATGLLASYLAFGYPTQSWYYLGAVAIGAVSIDGALDASRQTWQRVARAGLAALVLVAGFTSARNRLGEPLTNIDSVGAHLSAHATAGDLVVTNPWYLGVSLHRYYQGPARVIAVPPAVDTHVHRFDLVKAAMVTPDPLRDLLDDVRSTLSSGRVVWVVGTVASAPAQFPTTRPPPPLPGTGWNSGPYEVAWTFALGNQLRDHAVDRSAIALDSRRGRVEATELTAFRGWR